MTRALQLQGQLFCALALALAVASLAGARLEPRIELVVAGTLVLLLGVPHGAFDALVARKHFAVTGFKGWAWFSLRYLGLAAAVVGFWAVAPTLFLCVFLIVSALHFAGDPVAGVSGITRGLYGGAVIVLPALCHGADLQRLLGVVAGPDSAAFVVPVLSLLAAPWLAAALLACAYEFKSSRLAACELAGLLALFVAAPPLLAFCVFFCAMHSPRHILRTLATLQAAEVRQALVLAAWPTLAVLLMAALLGALTSELSLEARVLQPLFVGLAALTLPHMWLLERARRAASPAQR